MPPKEFNLSQIEDEKMRHLVGGLLNIIEDLRTEVRAVKAENQRLRDENNRLKGEQGKPNIKAKKPLKTHSSEKERRQTKKHQKKSKRNEIKIDREETLKVAREDLPSDARFKGYEEVVIQDIQVSTDNILFRKEKFYAKSTGKTYLAPLPAGYQGEFGANLRTQVLTLYYASQMTEAKIRDWLAQIGIQISVGQISNMLIKGHELFHQEASASYQASLEACPWQHIDDTGRE
ncbi:MAG: transposase [Anaerolineae bacterium]|nr:transposase [Anaerolineae bacterium]